MRRTNGRPEKLPGVSSFVFESNEISYFNVTYNLLDAAIHVCYSWWVLSSLIVIDWIHWIDKQKLVQFILDLPGSFSSFSVSTVPSVKLIVSVTKDKENGGISDRPDDAVDVYHTYFGIAGLSLLKYPGLKPIDPAYTLPVEVINRVFLSS